MWNFPAVMMFSLAVTQESKFLVKWKIVDIGDLDESSSFIQLFDHLKAGLVDGIDKATEWFGNQNLVEGQEHPVILDHVQLKKVYVGKNSTDLMECTPSLGAGRACRMFGSFVKICVKLEHHQECICQNRGHELGQSPINVFQLMTVAQRRIQNSQKTRLPDPVTPRNQLDKLNNELLNILKVRGLGWDHSRHFSFIPKLGKILWYIDGHHATLASRTKKIPEIFQNFTGYNRPEASKHRKRAKDNLKADVLKSHVITLQDFLGTVWIELEIWKDMKV